MSIDTCKTITKIVETRIDGFCNQIVMNEVNNTSLAISVIVPIYNMEKQIRKCLDSIMAQTFRNYECLLIDDGSTDSSGEICDEYAVKDSRFKAYHKENGGVSSARQFGIDHALGEYTIHADPDDWVEPIMLEELYRKAKEDDADMVICDFFENTYKGQNYIKQQPSALDHNTVLHDLFHHIHGSCCNKLIRRKTFIDNNVSFPTRINSCEDLYVNVALLINDIRVSYLGKAFYHYVRGNPNSLSRKYDDNSEKQNTVLMELFTNLMKDTELSGLVERKFSYTIVASAFWGGKSFYTSRQFSRRFSKYADSIKEPPHTVKKRLMYYSIKGWYHPLIDIVDFFMKLKRSVQYLY